jgi:predicted DNA-binding transcriptional regulator YafY
MSYMKAEQLLKLAGLASCRRGGISLNDVESLFSVSRRTAQRLTRALEQQFPDVEIITDASGRRSWRLAVDPLHDLLSLSAEELAALDLAIAQLRRSNAVPQAELLGELRDKIVSIVPRSMTRLEPDYVALLEVQGLVARPGPRPIVDKTIHDKLVDAIKACQIVTIRYRSNHSAEYSSRRIAPLGFLYGIRRYLVAEDPVDKRGPTLKTYRLDHVKAVRISDKYFTRPSGFDLEQFTNSAFGVFQRDGEIGDVIWRFKPEAAQNAESYQFHPSQIQERQADGSLLVKFRAAGLLEMAWHLYAWGDKVEVIAPRALKALVRGHQRKDFTALP